MYVISIMESTTFKERWHKAVSKRTPKRSKKYNKEDIVTISLQDLIENQTCPYNLVGKCREENCYNKHLTETESKIQYYTKDPSKIRAMKGNIAKIKQKINEITGDKNLKPFFTTCLFCLKGLECKNMSNGDNSEPNLI